MDEKVEYLPYKSRLSKILTRLDIGSITPVEPGRMRNAWYPRQRAAYMTAARLEGIKPQAVVAERDFTFGVTQAKQGEAPKIVQTAKPVEAQTKLLPVNTTSYQNAVHGLNLDIGRESVRNHGIFPAEPYHLLQNPNP